MDPPCKLRALSLAGLVVLSVFALTVPVSEPATAVGNTLTVGPGESYSTVEAAVNAAQSGDTVAIVAGRITSSDVTIDKALTIEGAGMDRTVIDVANSSHPGTQNGFEIAADNVTIRNLTMADGHNTLRISSTAAVADFSLHNVRINDSSIGMFVAGYNQEDNGEFDRVHIKNTRWIDNERKGIYLEKLSNALIEETVVDGVTSDTYGHNNGIDINLKHDDYSNITIRETVVSNVSEGDPAGGNPSFSVAVAIKARDDDGHANYGHQSGTPATLESVTLENVTVRDSFNGLRFGEPGATNFAANLTAVTVRGLTFESNAGYHVQVAVDGLQPTLAENTFVRDVRVNQPASRPAPETVWANIGDALDQAGVSDTLFVGPGTYPEDVPLGRNISIRGHGTPRPVVEGTLTTAANTVHSNVTVEHLTVEGAEELVEFANTGTVIDGVTFTDVHFRLTGDSTTPDSVLTVAGDGSIAEVRGHGLRFVDVSLSPNGYSYNNKFGWINIASGGPVLIDNMTVDGQADVHVNNRPDNVTVTRSQTLNGGSFYFDGIDTLRVNDSEFRHNGLTLNGVHDGNVTGNRFVDISAGKAIIVSSDWGSVGRGNNGTVIENNTFENLQTDAIRLTTSGSAPSNQQWNPTDPDELPTVRFNDFGGVDDGSYGVENRFAVTVDARFNWWGSPAGPGNSPNVSENVTYRPWLVQSEYVAPVANAGPDRVRTGTGPVTLDGSGSTVTTNQPTYQWSVAGRTLTGETASVTLSPGQYTATLTVDDGRVISTPDTASITVRRPAPSGGGGTAPAQTPAGQPPAVTQDPRTGERTYRKPVGDENPDEPGTQVRFQPVETDGETASPPVDEISFDGAIGGGEVSVREVTSRPDPAQVGGDTESVVRSFSIEASGSAENQPATVRFSVSQQDLLGRSVNDVRLARQLDDGSWETYEATPIGDLTADPIRFQSRVSGFSNWAVVLRRATTAPPTPVPTPSSTPVSTTARPGPSPETTPPVIEEDSPTTAPSTPATAVVEAPSETVVGREEPAGIDPTFLVGGFLSLVVLGVLFALWRRTRNRSE